MALNIRTYGDPVLRQASSPVAQVTDALRELADGMLETMAEANGLGLAAQQVGRTEALCVIHVPAELDVGAEGERLNPDVEMPLVLFNPEIVERSEEMQTGDEGCLSFPGIYASVERHWAVIVRHLDRHGETREIRVEGLLSRAIQHELDHLKGVLLCDRMSQVKRMALSGKLKRLRRDTKQELASIR